MNSSRMPKAVILAGGKGTRLKPFTAALPKPLVPLGDMSILEILLTRLGRLGVQEAIISTGHLAGLIRAVAGDGARFGVSISYSHEDSPLGTAGPLGLMEGLTEPTIVMNGDLLTTLDFRRLIAFHERKKADVTIATYVRNLTIDFGVVDQNKNGEFLGFKEKPKYDLNVSMGVNVLSSAAISRIGVGEYLDMPDLITRVASTGGRVCCYQEDCFWLDIGRVDDYALAQVEFEREQAKFLGEE